MELLSLILVIYTILIIPIYLLHDLLTEYYAKKIDSNKHIKESSVDAFMRKNYTGKAFENIRHDKVK